MSSDELDAFRAELLRQKVIFEAELRRQRDTFEEKLARVTQELADREADCRNLQAVVTILGKKVDTLHQKCPTTPLRRPSPTSNLQMRGTGGDTQREATPGRDSRTTRMSSPSARRPFGGRLQTQPSLINLPTSASSVCAPSVSSAGSRNTSPARQLHIRRPRLRS
ncbi:hypothetical protein, conserved [Trypanosoma brucei gambiense DAL972]|uniref:Uncharacterized protein n=3 Tax=Trypanosoma brucei TaxID=5691 RepID=Q38D98_TRYB2|nr:hypothetical protein, conserved [Trypanosoma brucei gambiense DAL972]XP_827552.1 hypothetical protein, conserved [Trypanosoma brucei brucei TREU927]EAN77222.1 hypothetical protein, conserved [Trypanosoma brucei brucei TREU927]RHW70109.1 hypothetical protein DPX39_090079700 [Trypanosoma brucei equiperdum]CBH14748.1 hypothetical protein, conserved [Trypanosoma brucei gambiense DAL972]|eukprot:XP_011777014.1 hypothetical protein, conserved [Trypanosoma brucei gambiense DAL972]